MDKNKFWLGGRLFNTASPRLGTPTQRKARPQDGRPNARLVSRPTRKPQIFLHVHDYSFSTDMGTLDIPALAWFPVATKHRKIEFSALAPVLSRPGLETPNFPHLHGSYRGRTWKPQVSRT